MRDVDRIWSPEQLKRINDDPALLSLLYDLNLLPEVILFNVRRTRDEERERCAKIADGGNPDCDSCRVDPQGCDCTRTSKLIAKKIRDPQQGKPPPAPAEISRPKSKLIMAKAFAHKGHTNMKRKDYEEYDIASVSVVVNHPELGRCYVGSWVCGSGAFHVHFPADAVRIATRSEVDQYTRGKFVSNFGWSSKPTEDDFATIADLDQMDVDLKWQEYS